MRRRGYLLGSLLSLLLVFSGAFGCGEDGKRRATLWTLDKLSLESEVLKPGETTTVSAETSATDDAPPALEWNVEGEGWTIEPDDQAGETAVLTAPVRYDATATLTVTAKNEEGRTSATAETISGSPPVIEAIAANPNPVRAGGTTTLSAQASSSVTDELDYHWSVGGEWSLQTETGRRVEVESPSAVATTSSTLRVADGNGVETTDTVTIATQGNHAPPIITALEVNPPVVPPKETTTVTARVTDLDGDSLSYDWTLPSDWSGMSDTGEIELTAPDEYGRVDRVTLEVSDAYGKSATDTVRVETESIIRNVYAEDNPLEPGGTTNVHALVTHPSDRSLSYDWSVDDGDWDIVGGGDTATLEAPETTNASARVKVEVTDGEAIAVAASVTVQTRGAGCPNANHERDVELTNGASDKLVDYQVPVTVDTASLISNGKMQSDCSDLRFYDESQKLNYWLESGCNTNATDVWVEVPEIPAGQTKSVSMCYGISGASSESSAEDTFYFYDDFDDNQLDSSVWSEKVNDGGTGSVTVKNKEMRLRQRESKRLFRMESTQFDVPAISASQGVELTYRTRMFLDGAFCRAFHDRIYLVGRSGKNHARVNYMAWSTKVSLEKSGATAKMGNTSQGRIDADVTLTVTGDSVAGRWKEVKNNPGSKKDFQDQANWSHMKNLSSLKLWADIHPKGASSCYQEIAYDSMIVRSHTDPAPTVDVQVP